MANLNLKIENLMDEVYMLSLHVLPEMTNGKNWQRYDLIRAKRVLKELQDIRDIPFFDHIVLHGQEMEHYKCIKKVYEKVTEIDHKLAYSLFSESGECSNTAFKLMVEIGNLKFRLIKEIKELEKPAIEQMKALGHADIVEDNIQSNDNPDNEVRTLPKEFRILFEDEDKAEECKNKALKWHKDNKNKQRKDRGRIISIYCMYADINRYEDDKQVREAFEAIGVKDITSRTFENNKVMACFKSYGKELKK